jgi:hypothetical protein
MRIADRILILAAAAVPLSPAIAQSQAPTPAQDNSSIIVKGQKEKKVCRTFEAPTGSRVGEKRICRSAQEWRVADDATQRNMDKMNLHIQADQAQTMNEKGLANRGLPH